MLSFSIGTQHVYVVQQSTVPISNEGKLSPATHRPTLNPMDSTHHFACRLDFSLGADEQQSAIQCPCVGPDTPPLSPCKSIWIGKWQSKTASSSLRLLSLINAHTQSAQTYSFQTPSEQVSCFAASILCPKACLIMLFYFDICLYTIQNRMLEMALLT